MLFKLITGLTFKVAKGPISRRLPEREALHRVSMALFRLIGARSLFNGLEEVSHLPFVRLSGHDARLRRNSKGEHTEKVPCSGFHDGPAC